MKTWQALLFHLLLAIGAATVPGIKDPTLQATVGTFVAVGTAAIAKRNSDTNPDGTSARGAFDPGAK